MKQRISRETLHIAIKALRQRESDLLHTATWWGEESGNYIRFKKAALKFHQAAEEIKIFLEENKSEEGENK